MRISLRAPNGQYLAAEQNGGGAVNANRDEARTWETFELVQAGSRFGLATTGGWFLRSARQENRLVADSRCLESAAGTLFEWDAGATAIRTIDDWYLSADQGGGSHVEVNRAEIGPWERWRMYDHANGQPPDNVAEPTPGPGLAIPEHRLTGAFLYNKPFFLPGRIFSMSRDELENRAIPSMKGLGNIAVCTVNWHGADEFTERFHGLDHPEHVIDTLQLLDANGLAPIVFGMGQEYFTNHLGFNFSRLYEHQQRSAELVAPYCRWFLAMWEGAETLGGRYNAERRRMIEAIRAGAVDAGVPDLRIGRHERALEGVFVEDLQFIGPVVMALQTGFPTPEPELRRFIREDTARIRGFASGGENGLYHGGRFGAHDCAVVAFEHSIPDVSPRWPVHQTWEQAQARGLAALESGAFVDLSGGVLK